MHGCVHVFMVKSIDVDLRPFYPSEFQVLADSILSLIDFSQNQITAVNCKFVYSYLAFVFMYYI